MQPLKGQQSFKFIEPDENIDANRPPIYIEPIQENANTPDKLEYYPELTNLIKKKSRHTRRLGAV